MDFTALYGASSRLDLMLLAKYCESLAGRSRMPQRRAFRPSRVPAVVGKLYLIDVLDGGADYRFRLFGLFWEKLYGFDITDQLLSELEQQGHLTALRPDYDAVVASRQSMHHAGKLVWSDGKSIRYERLLVPLSDDDETVSQIVVAAGCDVALNDLGLHTGVGRPRLVLD